MAVKSATVMSRIEPDLKKEAEDILHDLGIIIMLLFCRNCSLKCFCLKMCAGCRLMTELQFLLGMINRFMQSGFEEKRIQGSQRE